MPMTCHIWYHSPLPLPRPLNLAGTAFSLAETKFTLPYTNRSTKSSTGHMGSVGDKLTCLVRWPSHQEQMEQYSH